MPGGPCPGELPGQAADLKPSEHADREQHHRHDRHHHERPRVGWGVQAVPAGAVARAEDREADPSVEERPRADLRALEAVPCSS